MFYITYKNGFIGDKLPTCNIRLAKPFTTYVEADTFAKNQKLKYYAILKSANGA